MSNKVKKSYNSGLETGIKLSEEIVSKDAKALERLSMQIDNMCDKQDKFKYAIERIMEVQNSNAVQEYYDICLEKKPCDLPDAEKEVLMHVLSTLAFNMSNYNEYQKDYLANIKGHMRIETYTPVTDYNFELLDNIRDLDNQEVIVRCIREFLFLLNYDNSFEDDYEELFDCFSVKKKTIRKIDETIFLTYQIFGVSGIVEMYGNHRVVGDENVENTLDDSYDDTFYEMSDELADKINTWVNYIETNRYIVCIDRQGYSGSNYISIDKCTGEEKNIVALNSFVADTQNIGKFSNKLYIPNEEVIYEYDLYNDRIQTLFKYVASSDTHKSDEKCLANGQYIVCGSPFGASLSLCSDEIIIYAYNIVNKDIKECRIKGGESWTLYNSKLFFIDKQILKYYDIESDSIVETGINIKIDINRHADIDGNKYILRGKSISGSNNAIQIIDLDTIDNKFIETDEPEKSIFKYYKNKVFFIRYSSMDSFGYYDVDSGKRKVLLEKSSCIDFYEEGILKKKKVWVLSDYLVNMNGVKESLYFLISQKYCGYGVRKMKKYSFVTDSVEEFVIESDIYKEFKNK